MTRKVQNVENGDEINTLVGNIINVWNIVLSNGILHCLPIHNKSKAYFWTISKYSKFWSHDDLLYNKKYGSHCN